MEEREPEYKVEDLWVTFPDLEKHFEVFDDRRHIRGTQVDSIVATLKAGKHFDSPMVVNKVDGRYRIIDGNHRYEALKRYLEVNKGVKILLKLAVYSNLTPIQERETYTKWAIGIKQTIDDLLNLRRNEIPLYNILLKKGLPVAIYKGTTSNSVPLNMIVKMLYATFNTEELFSDSGLRRQNIVEVAKEYDNRHAEFIVGYFNVFEEALGGFKHNRFLRPCFCVPMFNVYVLNTNMPKKELVERFSGCLSDTEILQRLSEHSREALSLMRERIFTVCDRGKRNKMNRGVCKV